MKFSTGSQNLACFSNRKPHDHVVRPRWHHSVVMVNVLPSTSVCVTSTSQAPKDITTGKPCRQFHFPCLSWNWRNDGYIMDTKCTRKRLEPHECPRCITKGSYTGRPSINGYFRKQAPKPTSVQTIRREHRLLVESRHLANINADRDCHSS